MTYDGLDVEARELFSRVALSTMEIAHNLTQTASEEAIARTAIQLEIDILQVDLEAFGLGMVEGRQAFCE